MEILNILIEIFIHLDKNLAIAISNYGLLVYPLLFLIVFVETGIVIFPFLPGDSLLFAAGTLAGAGLLNLLSLFFLLCIAAILGDSINYFIGKSVGNSIIRKGYVRREYLQRTQQFYDKHGGKTILLARFVPIIRTFAPFVAGIGKMRYSYFLFYNVFGGILWVSLFLLGGFFFGGLEVVKNNFSLVILIIIFLSILPIIIEFLKHKLRR